MTKKNPCDCDYLEALYESEGVPKDVMCRHEHYCPTCKASCCSETGIAAPMEHVDLPPEEVPWQCMVCSTLVRPIRLIQTQPSQETDSEQ